MNTKAILSSFFLVYLKICSKLELCLLLHETLSQLEPAIPEDLKPLDELLSGQLLHLHAVHVDQLEVNLHAVAPLLMDDLLHAHDADADLHQLLTSVHLHLLGVVGPAGHLLRHVDRDAWDIREYFSTILDCTMNTMYQYKTSNL